MLDTFQPSSARARFEAIHSTLRERILLLDYPPGSRLSEEALAREFGTSRTPVRRVLARLEDEGLLRSVQSVGTLVTDVDLDMLAQTYRMRMELAELIGRVDPVPASEETLDRMRGLRTDLAALRGTHDVRQFARINNALFRAILSLTENEPLREISERLFVRTTRTWIKSIDALHFDSEVAIFERELGDIVAAVEIGDLEAVGHIRRAHISMSFQRLKRNQNRP